MELLSSIIGRLEKLEHSEKRKCAKQTVIAIIVNGNDFFVGSNWCKNPQKICPREGFRSGDGYHLCDTICKQYAHAEVDACEKAGEKANGGKLFLIGQSYCCDNCKSVMNRYGIKKVYILQKEVSEIKNLIKGPVEIVPNATPTLSAFGSNRYD